MDFQSTGRFGNYFFRFGKFALFGFGYLTHLCNAFLDDKVMAFFTTEAHRVFKFIFSMVSKIPFCQLKP